MDKEQRGGWKDTAIVNCCPKHNFQPETDCMDCKIEELNHLITSREKDHELIVSELIYQLRITKGDLEKLLDGILHDAPIDVCRVMKGIINNIDIKTN